ALVFLPGNSTKFARFQSQQEPVVSTVPFALSGTPDLLRISAPSPAGAIPHLFKALQRLGVESPGEKGNGAADTLSLGETLRIEIGDDVSLGSGKATEVFLRFNGTTT